MSIAKPWLAHYPSETPVTLSYPQIPLTDYLLQAAKDFPDHPALYFMGKRLTFQQLLRQCYQFAHVLKNRGISKGDRVAIMLPNTPQAIIAYYATLFLGAIVVQTNPLYTERELLHQLTDSGAKAIVTLDLLAQRVLAIREQTALQYIFVTSIGDYLPLLKKWLYPLVQRRQKNQLKPNQTHEMESFAGCLRESPSTPISTEIDPDHDLALLQYTGGTTGQAKGVMLTHKNLVANTEQCRAVMYKLKRGQLKTLGALPLFHVYGMTTVMNLSIMMAAEIVLVPRYDVKQILKLIHTQKPNLFPGAPTMYIGLINHPDLSRYDLSSIEVCVSGSAALPLEVQQRFERLSGGRLVEGYGLTEASPVTHSNPLWERRVPGSIGLPWPDTDCRIVDLESGEDVPVGEYGELLVSGPQVMKGYWNQPEETEAALREGWLYTGDIAYMDEDGYFYIVERKKDMIIAGGFNIYPREIEEVLFEHPAVQEAAVAGVPDEYRGETVKAFVVVKQGQQVSEAELDEFCRQRLAAYKVPRVYEFRDQLPKTMVGKVLRRKLLEESLDNEAISG